MEVGVELEYLPPYSPDLDPIEESFAKLKAWMHKHSDLTRGYIEREEFEDFIVLAVKQF